MTTAGNASRGSRYAQGLKSGDRVEAGQPIGFVGDSGDANGIHPHLHFEVHPNGGATVSPFPYLKRALRLLFAEPEGATFTLVLDGTVVKTADGLLSLKVERLREWPSHQHQTKVNRMLSIAVPADALIEAAPSTEAESLQLPLTLSSAVAGQKVTVWTAAAPATAAARAGASGALTAARVVLR